MVTMMVMVVGRGRQVGRQAVKQAKNERKRKDQVRTS